MVMIIICIILNLIWKYQLYVSFYKYTKVSLKKHSDCLLGTKHFTVW